MPTPIDADFLAILASLADADVKIRARGLSQLKGYPRLPPEAVDPLLDLLSDIKEWVRPYAAWRLYHGFERLPDRAIDPLLHCLLAQGDSSAMLAEAVLASLRFRFDTLPAQAIPHLLRWIDSTRNLIRDHVVWTLLTRFDQLPSNTIAPLGARLRDAQPEVRLGAALALRDRFDELPGLAIDDLRRAFRSESHRWIRVVLALALIFAHQNDAWLIPAVLDGVAIDEEGTRESCAVIYSFCGTLESDDRGRFARLCLPHAFHADARIDMSSSIAIIQSEELVGRLSKLVRKYARRRSDFADDADLLSSLQAQFSIQAAITPAFETPLANIEFLLDNAVNRVDSRFAYEFRSRFQGFAGRRSNRWHRAKLLDPSSADWQQLTVPSRAQAALERREMATILTDVLELLAPPQRYLIQARVFDELTWREIAERLELPVSTVQSQFERALTAFRRFLPDLGEGDCDA